MRHADSTSADRAAVPLLDADDASPLANRQSRLGLILFAVYTAVYGGFVAIAAFLPRAMARPVWDGVNLAVIYGLGLIIGAILLAVVYMAACGRMARDGATDRDST